MKARIIPHANRYTIKDKFRKELVTAQLNVIRKIITLIIFFLRV